MKATEKKDHEEAVKNQFERQAIPFAALPGHLDAIQTLIGMSGAESGHRVLDVACGPGLVACEFAGIVEHVTGIDLVPRMIEQAKQRQSDKKLGNLSWDVGSAVPLPYTDDMFDIVITRYSFHHFLDPAAVLREMIRVCKPGGVVLIADVALPENKAEAYNRMEKLRDPSHVRALTYKEWRELLGESGLINLRKNFYTVEMELEKQLQASFPNPGDADRVRTMFRKDIGVDALGVCARLIDGEIRFGYPVSIFAGNKTIGAGQ